MQRRSNLLILGIVSALALTPSTALAWTKFSVPSPGGSAEYVELRADSCFDLESATEAVCYAAGNFKATSTSARSPLVEKYTSAGGWVVQSVSAPTGATASRLDNITCRSKTECIAVGEYTNASGENLSLGEWLHSGSWSVDNPTSPPSSWDRDLTGVSCPANLSLECMAVGNYHTVSPGYDVALAYRWSGGTWSSPLYPLNPAGSTSDSVGEDSCPSAACVAVNTNRNSGYEHETLAESVTSMNAWSYLTTPSLAPAHYSAFYGDDCPSSVSECVAVGTTNESGKEQALVEDLATTTWSVGPSTYPSGAQRSDLATVSCISGVSVCMAVGEDLSSGGVEEAMAEYLYSSFASLDTPIFPTGASSSHFEGVSCTGEACMAVGRYAASGTGYGLAERNY